MRQFYLVLLLIMTLLLDSCEHIDNCKYRAPFSNRNIIIEGKYSLNGKEKKCNRSHAADRFTDALKDAIGIRLFSNLLDAKLFYDEYSSKLDKKLEESKKELPKKYQNETFDTFDCKKVENKSEREILERHSFLFKKETLVSQIKSRISSSIADTTADTTKEEETLFWVNQFGYYKLKEFLESGFSLSDIDCTKHFDNVSYSQAHRNHLRDITNLSGGFIATIEGLAGVTNYVIAGTAALFSFADSQFLTYDKNFVVTPNISFLQEVVFQKRKKAKNDILNRLQNKSIESFHGVQSELLNYTNICSFNQWCPVSFLHALKDGKKMKKHELFA